MDEINVVHNTDKEFIKPALLFVLIAFLVGLFWAGCQSKEATSQLHFDDSVAEDFRTLASETWQLFLMTFDSRKDCFGDVFLQTDPTLSSRATYLPENAVVIVRVPGTPAFLQAALIHEWAHHIEYQCQEHQLLRPALLESLELPPETPWRIGHTWADTPSEQYAEAVVELVLGDHPLPTKIQVNQDTVTLLAEWVHIKDGK